MYQKRVFEDMQNNGRNLNILFQKLSGLGKSRFARFCKKNQYHTRVSIHLYCPTAKDARHMISLIQEYKAQDVITPFDDIDATSFGFQEF